MIHGLPPVYVEPMRWIPVAERLPESCGMYIVTRKIYDCPDTAPIIMSDESWFDGQNTWHNDNRINHERGYLSDVIAWMPLPEPFEPQKSEERGMGKCREEISREEIAALLARESEDS